MSSPGVDELVADDMKLDGYFLCMCNVPGICDDECSLQNLWASFEMSWTAGNSLWSNFNMAFLHSFFVPFYINEYVDAVNDNGLQHRANSST